jgi:hypothetical protein
MTFYKDHGDMFWNVARRETWEQRWCLRPYLGFEQRLVEGFLTCVWIVRRGAYNLHAVSDGTNARCYRSKGCSREGMFNDRCFELVGHSCNSCYKGETTPASRDTAVSCNTLIAV